MQVRKHSQELGPAAELELSSIGDDHGSSSGGGSSEPQPASQRELAEDANRSPHDAPRVALMFLTRGPVPLERVWREFFATAAEIEPVSWLGQRRPRADEVSQLPLQPGAEPEQAVAQRRLLHASGSGRGSGSGVREPPLGTAGQGVQRQHWRWQQRQEQQQQQQHGQHGARPFGSARLSELWGCQQSSTLEQQGLLGWLGVLRESWPLQQQQSKQRQLLAIEQQQQGQQEQGQQQQQGQQQGQQLRRSRLGDQEALPSIAGLPGELPAPEELLGGAAGDLGNAGWLGRMPSSEVRLSTGRAKPSLLLRLAGHEASSSSSSSIDDSAPSRLSPRDPKGVIAQQALFGVYVHTAPQYAFPKPSIFSGYQIADRVEVAWGQYTVAEAERRLLKAALEDPRNQRFVLLSESCAPLYPPQVVYLQLLSDGKSRLNACNQPGRLAERWSPAMYRPGYLSPFKWRKSSQWKSLLREHAQLIVDDSRLWRVFRQDCYTFLHGSVPAPPHLAAVPGAAEMQERNCVSDEHYVATLLATYNRDNETMCMDTTTHTVWTGGWSPQVHGGRQVSRALIQRLRKPHEAQGSCNAAEAIGSANSMFRRKGAPGTSTLSGRPVQQAEYKPLSARCFLFARKFSPDAAPWLLVLARDCLRGTGIARSCLPQ